MDAEHIAANALKNPLNKEEEIAMEAHNENAQMQHLKRSDTTTKMALSAFFGSGRSCLTPNVPIHTAVWD